MQFCFYKMQILIVTYLLLQGLCASPCLAISVANSNVKPSSPQVIISPSIPASAKTATVIPLAIGGLLIFIFGLVAAAVFIVLRTKWQKKKIIDVLEQDFKGEGWWLSFSNL